MSDGVGQDTAARPRYVGARVPRVEDARLVTGRGRYLDDHRFAGAADIAFVRSPYPHARIVSVDAEAALAMPEVLGVYSGADLEPLVKPLPASGRHGPQTLQHALPVDKARYVGEPVVAVVAEDRYAAEDACELVRIEWEPLPAVMDPRAALAPGAPVIHENIPDNNSAHTERAVGDIDGAFANAAHVFSAPFRTGRYAAMPLELRGMVAEWNAGTGVMQLWSATQIPHLVRSYLAPALGLEENRVEVIAPELGGGFGLKSHVFVEEAVVCAIARELDVPIRWNEDRYEHLAASTHAKELYSELEIAVDENGRFLALRGKYMTDAGAFHCIPYTSLVNVLEGAAISAGLYDLENVAYEIDAPFTNKCQMGAYRGVGWGPVQTAREVLIDQIARKLDRDPIDLRLQNMIPSAPYKAAMGQAYDGGSYREALLQVRERVGYDEFRARQRELREQGRYIGIGVTPYIEVTGTSNPIAKANGMTDGYHDSARVTVDADGSVTVTTGLHSHGQGHETTFAQVVADRLGVALESVRIQFGDTRAGTYGMGTFASRSAVVGAGLVTRASDTVRARLCEIAGHMLEAAPEDIVLERGVAAINGAPDRSVTVAEIAKVAYKGGSNRPRDVQDFDLTATASYEPGEAYTNGAVAVVVEVDPDLGTVKVLKAVSVSDCGVMLNPTIVEGQIAGGIAQGIGGALYEDIVYGEDGQLQTTSLMEYLYPSAMEIPPMEFGHIETPSPNTIGGVKGVGEAGKIAGPGATLNAVADALAPFGVEVVESPLGPSQIIELIAAAKASKGAGPA